MDTAAPNLPLFADANGVAMARDAYLTTLADVVGAAVGYPGLFFTSDRLDFPGVPDIDRWRSMATFLADTAWTTMADGDTAQGSVLGLTLHDAPAGNWEASLTRAERHILPTPRPFHGDHLGVRSALSFTIDGLANGVVLSKPEEAVPVVTEEGQRRACGQAIQFLCSSVVAAYGDADLVPIGRTFSFILHASMAGASHAITVSGSCKRVS